MIGWPWRSPAVKPGVEVVLQRHEGYFGGPKGKPAIKNMIIRSIPDMGTQQAELMVDCNAHSLLSASTPSEKPWSKCLK